MSFKTNPIEIPDSNIANKPNHSYSCPPEKISLMFNILNLRDAPYHNNQEISKSAPTKNYTDLEQDTVLSSDKNDSILFNYMKPYLSDDERDNNSNNDNKCQIILDESDIDNESFDGDFTKNTPVIRKIFENVARCLMMKS